MTKEAELMLSCIYKEYLQRISVSPDDSSSNFFKAEFLTSNENLVKIPSGIIYKVRNELISKGYLKAYMSQNFELTSDGIAYMQKLFKNNIIDVTKFIVETLSSII